MTDPSDQPTDPWAVVPSTPGEPPAPAQPWVQPGYPPPGSAPPGYAQPGQPYGQPGYAQPPYGQPPYGHPGQPPYGYPAQPPYGSPYGYQAPGNNGLAIASLVCSILGFLYGIPAILGIVFGFVARNQIKQRPQGGSGMALAGIIIGFLWLGLIVLGVVVALAGVATMSST